MWCLRDEINETREINHQWILWQKYIIYVCVCFFICSFQPVISWLLMHTSYIGQCSQGIIHSCIHRGRMPSRKVLNFRPSKIQLLVFLGLRNRNLVFQNFKNANKTSNTPACKIFVVKYKWTKSKRITRVPLILYHNCSKFWVMSAF